MTDSEKNSKEISTKKGGGKRDATECGKGKGGANDRGDRLRGKTTLERRKKPPRIEREESGHRVRNQFILKQERGKSLRG